MAYKAIIKIFSSKGEINVGDVLPNLPKAELQFLEKSEAIELIADASKKNSPRPMQPNSQAELLENDDDTEDGTIAEISEIGDDAEDGADYGKPEDDQG